MKNENSKLKIIFVGASEFGAIILEKLRTTEFNPCLAITAPDKQPEKILDFKSEISNLKPDLMVMVACGQILPREILDIPKYGCLAVHPSLLPKYRGPSPIQAAILNNDEETGVTIILMDEKMDHGPILAQRKSEIRKDENTSALRDKLANQGAGLLIETISKRLKGLLKPQPQDETRVIYTKILNREDGRIIWEKAAEELEREIRAFSDWPGSFTFWERRGGKMVKIKILKARIQKSMGGVSYSLGKTLVVPQNEIGVQCGTRAAATIGFLRGGDFLVIERLQLEGGEEMVAEDFLRGYPDFIGTTLK